MKKTMLVMAMVIALVLSATAAFASQGKGSNPFDALASAIASLADRVDSLENAESSEVGISHSSESTESGTVPAMKNGLPGSVEIVAECQNPDHLAISGGYTAGSYKGGVTTYQNRNTAGAVGTDEYGAGWLVGFTNTTDQPQRVRTWVVCADVVEDEG